MVATATGDEGIISKLRAKFEAGGLTLPQKYRALTSLRNCSNASATAALLVALRDPSALFRHDVAFALGQRQDADAIDALTALLEDPSEHCMVRHEAGEALGAIGTPECLVPVLRHAASSVPEVRDTCLLAQQRLEFFARQDTSGAADAAAPARFQSVDPTPPFPTSVTPRELVAMLIDEAAPLFDRYRALFALRDRGGDTAVAVMAQCLSESRNALLKHEIAYVLGQMQDRMAVQSLQRALKVCVYESLAHQCNKSCQPLFRACELKQPLCDIPALVSHTDAVCLGACMSCV